MSLQDLPRSILRIILEYIPNVESLCNLDCTSRELHKLVRENWVWEPRLARQWKVRKQSNRTSSSPLPSVPVVARDEFARRFTIEKDIIQCVSRLRTTTEQLRMLYAFSFCMSKENDGVDVLWRLFKHHKNEETQQFARGILRYVQMQKEFVLTLHDD